MCVSYTHLVLHLKYKDAYFRSKGWESEWIAMAIELLHAIWEEKYQPLDKNRRLDKDKKRVFDEIDDWEGSFSSSNDELNNYLASPTIYKVGNPILYWQSQAHAGLASEAFAQMAIDHLSCPGKCLAYIFLL